MRTRFRALTLCCLFGAAGSAWAQWTPMNPVTSLQRQTDGIVLPLQTGVLKLQVCSDSIIRVRYALTAAFPEAADPVVVKSSWSPTRWSVAEAGDLITLATERMSVVIDRKDSSLSYKSLDGKSLVQEASRKLMPVKVNGEDTYRAESFLNIYGSREGLYGLGQQQAGVWNHRGNIGGAVPGQLQHRRALHGLEQRLWHLLEQRLAQPVQQPLRQLPVHQLRGGRRHRLLLHLRPRAGPGGGGLSRADRATRPCSGSGPTASGSARTATRPRPRFWAWRRSTAS